MKEVIESVLDLQPFWVQEKTEEMDVRGQLVRRGAVEWLSGFSEDLASAIGITSEDLIVEGRDGTGRKTENPWVRFGCRIRSPHATDGWYCVYQFDTKGENAYLCLGRGATSWTGADFRPRPLPELRRAAAWARELVKPLTLERTGLTGGLQLYSRRSDLGPSYEAATALALQYERSNIPDATQLIEDALFMAGLLKAVYSETDLGLDPLGIAPEVLESIGVADSVAGRSSRSAGSQGFRLDSKQRRSIELHAMEMARTHLESLGWTVRDRSSTKPYDFYCEGPEGELYVEVKGTTSRGSQIILTRGEVEHHQEVYPANALLVVSEIELSGADARVASGGTLSFRQPWQIVDEQLRVISYTYDVKSEI